MCDNWLIFTKKNISFFSFFKLSSLVFFEFVIYSNIFSMKLPRFLWFLFLFFYLFSAEEAFLGLFLTQNGLCVCGCVHAVSVALRSSKKSTQTHRKIEITETNTLWTDAKQSDISKKLWQMKRKTDEEREECGKRKVEMAKTNSEIKKNNANDMWCVCVWFQCVICNINSKKKTPPAIRSA